MTRRMRSDRAVQVEVNGIVECVTLYTENAVIDDLMKTYGDVEGAKILPCGKNKVIGMSRYSVHGYVAQGGKWWTL